MKLIDTNIFIYAVGRPHEYKDSCITLLSEVNARRIAANIDVELLQEILHRYWQRSTYDEGMRLFDEVVAAFPDPIPIGIADVRRAREVLEANSRIAPRDAIHAAVVLEHRLEGIISTDRGFDAIPGVTRFDPRDL